MWKPSSVVPHHRNRATVVWVAILTAAFVYTVLQSMVVIRKRQNPSTKLTVSNQQYQFPVVTVCLDHGQGCGFSSYDTEGCIASSTWFSQGWHAATDWTISPSRSQVGNCIEYDFTRFDIPEGERDNATRVTAGISMDWVSSDNASAEVQYSAGVGVFLSDGSGDLGAEEYIYVPYSRNVAASDERSYDATAITIGKTKRKYLSGTSIVNYPVLTISTTRFVQTKDWDAFSSSSSTFLSSSAQWKATNESAYGSLYMDITQGSYSHTEVEDIEPLEIGALFGNIGGFWELLVLAWGVFFISKSRDTEPTQKARNFAKVFQFGDTKKRKRRTLDSAAAEEGGRDGPRPPDWDSGSDDNAHASGTSDSGASEKGERSRRHHAHRSARSRRPVAQPLPRRVSLHSQPSSLGTSATTRNALLLPRRCSASDADVIVSTTMPTEASASSHRWSGSNAASAARVFNTYDNAATAQQARKEVFTVNGSRSDSFGNYPNNGGDQGRARTSFFPTPQTSTSRIQPGSEDESSRSATRPSHGTNKFAKTEDEGDESELERGYAGESEGRHDEAF